MYEQVTKSSGVAEGCGSSTFPAMALPPSVASVQAADRTCRLPASRRSILREGSRYSASRRVPPRPGLAFTRTPPARRPAKRSSADSAPFRRRHCLAAPLYGFAVVACPPHPVAGIASTPPLSCVTPASQSYPSGPPVERTVRRSSGRRSSGREASRPYGRRRDSAPAAAQRPCRRVARRRTGNLLRLLEQYGRLSPPRVGHRCCFLISGTGVLNAPACRPSSGDCWRVMIALSEGPAMLVCFRRCRRADTPSSAGTPAYSVALSLSCPPSS